MGSVGGETMGTDEDGPGMLSLNDDGKAELSAGERSKSSVGSDNVDGIVSEGIREPGSTEGDLTFEGRSRGGVGGWGVGKVDRIEVGRFGLGAACCCDFSQDAARDDPQHVPSRYWIQPLLFDQELFACLGSAVRISYMLYRFVSV